MEPLLLLWLWDITVVTGRLLVGGSAAAIYVYNNFTAVFVRSLSDGNNWSTYILVYLIFLLLENETIRMIVRHFWVCSCLFICINIKGNFWNRTFKKFEIKKLS